MRALSAVVAFLVLVVGAAVSAQDGGPVRPSLLKATFDKLPIYFVENRGVFPDDVAYYVQGADKTLFFTKEGITFRLKGKEQPWVVKLEFVGCNPKVRPEGQDKQQAVFSYFRGPQKDWKTGLKTFSKIVYRDLWPGIDLGYRAGVGTLKYEFIVAPGADPARIRLRYRGVTSLTTTDSGTLRVQTPEGSFEDAPPEAWQEVDSVRVSVAMAFIVEEKNNGDGRSVHFEVGSYDRTRPLILDPAILLYYGSLRGSANDMCRGIAVDGSGNAYVTGWTESAQASFPVRGGPDLTFNGTKDAFVAKVNAAGTGLVYCGYIGGLDIDQGDAIAVDSSGNAYVTGCTRSTEASFPVTIGPDSTFNGFEDAFVAKVNAAGTGLVYCGFVGGSGRDAAYGLAVDSSGNAYVTGYTQSTEASFPVRGGPDLTFNGQQDVFVAKVSATGQSLVYCGYLGGSGLDFGNAVAVDASGNAYVVGNTTSTEATFPVTVGPDVTYNGGTVPTGGDAFVAKVDATGSSLVFCGYVGGSGDDASNAVAVDATGSAWMTGWTMSTETSFPVIWGPDPTHNGLWDAYVARVSPTGSSLVCCGYLGGAGDDCGNGIATDSAGNVYVAGYTGSSQTTFPLKGGPDLTRSGLEDAFVAKVSATGRSLFYCGYIGVSVYDRGQAIALDAAGNAYVTGATSSVNSFDSFVAKVAYHELSASGTGRPGSVVTLLFSASNDVGFPYHLGTSLGVGPISIDKRTLGLSLDPLLLVSTSGLWPWIFQGYRGTIDSKGQAQAAIHIPSIPALIGVRLHSAFVTLDPAAPSGIRSISNTETFTITK